MRYWGYNNRIILINVITHICVNHFFFIYSLSTHSIEKISIYQSKSIDIGITILYALSR